jgi:germination protein M
MRRSLKLIAVGSMLMALLISAGCDKDTKTVENQNSSSGQQVQEKDAVKKDNEKVTAQTMSINVYFPNEDGTKLIAVKKKIETADKYTAAMQALMEGTGDKKEVSIIPKDAKLKSVKVKDGIAKVDFSKELVKKFTGGSTGELMLVGSIVDTLTEFPEVKAVQILVEGKSVETIAGHMDTSEPLKRMTEFLK